ncbi:MAG TPA: glycogen synthase GlgA [Candidatus Hydrogenedentes bacterium]|nr:glycogen synthase GlgA [Candidatus Hydrogenedentota bacterium]HPG66701.1 glycogen synthase GlgA [Candidatus Hydrogenedentota bacterium]
MPEALKILYMTSELAPLVSTGGLGDVANALPRALHALGHDVRVAIPCYDAIPPEYRGDEYCMCVIDLGGQPVHGAMRVGCVPETEIPLYLIEHHEFFSRGAPYGFGAYEFEDNAARFCFFSLAVLDGVPQTGWKPDLVHVHDWHTSAVPAYLKTRPLRDPTWRDLPSLLTIHNLNYQGRYPASRLPQTGLPPELFTEDCLEFYGDLNLMKAGIAFASKVNTVSPTYAEEIQTQEFGAGLEGFLRTRTRDVTGILNGVDYSLWHPERDPFTPVPFSVSNMAGKQTCKAALQAKVGLPVRDVPVFGMVTRISWQKGTDLVVECLDHLLGHDIQLVVLGVGDPFYEQTFRDAVARHPGKLTAIIRFDVALSHLITAGSDFFLMPSRYEPCGLSQMYSLAYGTVPICHRTGGLADSIRSLSTDDTEHGRGTGILFAPFGVAAFLDAVGQAIALYQDRKALTAVRRAGMSEDFSWTRAAEAYESLFRAAMASP